MPMPDPFPKAGPRDPASRDGSRRGRIADEGPAVERYPYRPAHGVETRRAGLLRAVPAAGDVDVAGQRQHPRLHGLEAEDNGPQARHGSEQRPWRLFRGRSGSTGPAHHGRIEGRIPERRRVDIQFLRALAILSVLAHHLRISFVPGGFLGVDLFFVISGFLMASIIDGELERGTFSFVSFYKRRIRRLIPASFATLVGTSILAPLILDPAEYAGFVKQLLGSFLFTANAFLFFQSSYFGSAAVYKPLLHMWSLSIEEQFYIVFPALLWVSPTKFRLLFVLLLSVLSAGLCLYLVQINQKVSFYLLPTRAWELGIGAAVALGVRRDLIKPFRAPVLRLSCAGLIAVLLVLIDERGHPGWPALLVCLLTGALLVPGAQISATPLYARLLLWFGDRSYSIYLIHWPLISFGFHLYITEPPSWFFPAVFGLTLVLAELQYRFVEQRFRDFAFTPRTWISLGAMPLACLCAGLTWAQLVRNDDSRSVVESAALFSRCDHTQPFGTLPSCAQNPSAHLLLWGDSFAIHLSDGLKAVVDGGIIQATKSNCGPILGLAPLDGGTYTEKWGGGCIAFNDSVLAFLEHATSIQTVVLSTPLSQYVPGSEQANGWRYLVRDENGTDVRSRDLDVFLGGLQNTVARIRALGKKVVFFAPPPRLGFDIARCLSRESSGRFSVSPYEHCTFARAEYRTMWQPVVDAVSDIERRNIVPVVSLEDFLCASGTCRTRLGETMLYRDGAHLSVTGSIAMARAMDWKTRIDASAE